MKYKICKETIEKLIEIYRDNEKILKTIEMCLASFGEYHDAILKMELWMKVYSKAVTGGEYKDAVSKLDSSRTVLHNSVIGNVSLLNRLADNNNLPAVYGGTVSRDKPFRRELADAVLEYVEEIVRGRR